MSVDKEEIYIVISNNIRAERSRCRKTQDEVAEKLGIDRTTYTNWENRPKIDSVDMKEQKLNVLIDLFGQETSVEVEIGEVETI